MSPTIFNRPERPLPKTPKNKPINLRSLQKKGHNRHKLHIERTGSFKSYLRVGLIPKFKYLYKDLGKPKLNDNQPKRPARFIQRS